MQLSDAISLIQSADLSQEHPANWADLGCGSGLFTYALGSLLPPDSAIYAIDSARTFVKQPSPISVHFQQADFTQDALQVPKLDGVLMANSLHYVQDKPALLQRLISYLSANGVFIIVEYDTTRANPWVPFPEKFSNLAALFAAAGFPSIARLGERRSIYGQGNMYACLIKR